MSRLFYSAFLNRTDYTDPSFAPTVMYSDSNYIIINEICKFSLQIIIIKINEYFSNHCLQYPFELLPLINIQPAKHHEPTLPKK